MFVKELDFDGGTEYYTLFCDGDVYMTSSSYETIKHMAKILSDADYDFDEIYIKSWSVLSGETEPYYQVKIY